MKILTIPIHSFVDLITNSSTEVYVNADNGTIQAVKELINNILQGSGSTYNCDDLFDITLDGNEDDVTHGIVVTAKSDVPNLSNVTAAAKILSNLTGLFDITAEYNG